MIAEKRTASLIELEASLCRDSFYDFIRRFWTTIIPEQPVYNWHIERLCLELQMVAERVFRGEPKKYDLVINISPGSTKSTLCSILFPAWVWTRMPTARMICGSYAYDLAMDLSRKSRDVVQSEKWQALFGDVRLREDQNTKGYFVNTRGGGRKAVGTGGSITGMHGHFIIVDDPLDPKEAASEADLKAANNWMSDTLSTRKVDKRVTPTILIMQRLHQDDPSARMLARSSREAGRVRHICLPAELETDAVRDRVRPRSWAQYYQDKLMDPVRLPRVVLRQSALEMGLKTYSAQFIQSPYTGSGNIFKVDRIEVRQPPSKLRRVVRFWDKAGSHNKGAFTAGVKMGVDMDGVYWILDVKRGQWDAGERERFIKLVAQLDTTAVLVGLEQEPGSGGKESTQNTVRNLAGFKCVVDRPTGDKVLRATPFASQVDVGNVKLAPGPWNQAWMDEHQYFPESRYKDQVDASSGAFTVLTRGNLRVGGLKR